MDPREYREVIIPQKQLIMFTISTSIIPLLLGIFTLTLVNPLDKYTFYLGLVFTGLGILGIFTGIYATYKPLKYYMNDKELLMLQPFGKIKKCKWGEVEKVFYTKQEGIRDIYFKKEDGKFLRLPGEKIVIKEICYYLEITEDEIEEYKPLWKV